MLQKLWLNKNNKEDDVAEYATNSDNIIHATIKHSINVDIANRSNHNCGHIGNKISPYILWLSAALFAVT